MTVEIVTEAELKAPPITFDWTPCQCADCIGALVLNANQDPVWVSIEPTPWAIRCFTHGQVFLTNHAYNQQMQREDAGWVCPLCGERAGFDDANYDTAMSELEALRPAP